MSVAAETAWRDQVEKLIRWQQKVNKGDHAWRVKTWDEGENALGTFEVKPRVRWEPRRDTLIGFCGQKVEHVCKFGLEIEVGNGEAGYSKIVDSFDENIQVGPIIGHASDGDSRRRKLMVEDYLSNEGPNP
ncbi:hypothetical protein R1sor_009574 [Riccia sorocarpa]|uniref:Uncharacterized protein n=1 Tax=Riccia sorocarpa TaxID=122646 RepID=A0ABD3HVR4_9MARC